MKATTKATLAFKEKHKPIPYKFICEHCSSEFIKEMSEQRYSRKENHPRFCCRACANSRIRTDEIKQKISNSLKGKPTIPHSIYKKYFCKYCGKQFTMLDIRNTTGRNYCSSECRESWLKEFLYPKCGGYRKGSGYGKSGWYKGIHCDSSWELAFLIYHLEHNIPIQRCAEIRKYIYKGKEFEYHPDFIVNNQIIEIKGICTDQWKCKELQNSDIKVLYEKDMELYLDYVIHKYGNDFISLYDDSKPQINYLLQKNIWVHKYDDVNKIYYTKVINPKDLEDFIKDGWIKGRGKPITNYTKINYKSQGIFTRK